MATWTGSRAASQTKKSNGNTGSGTATCRWLEAGASVGGQEEKKRARAQQASKKERKQKNEITGLWLSLSLNSHPPSLTIHGRKGLPPPSSSSLSLLLFLVPLHFPPARSSSQTHANPNPGPLFETFENSNKNRGGQSGQFYPCRAYFSFFSFSCLSLQRQSRTRAVRCPGLPSHSTEQYRTCVNVLKLALQKVK